jgi:hypothetical protein
VNLSNSILEFIFSSQTRRTFFVKLYWQRKEDLMRLLAMFFVLISAVSCGGGSGSISQISETWDWFNNPKVFERGYEFKLTSLPSSGEIAPTPWSDTYWPSFRGGIADRWQTWDDPFQFKTPDFPDKLSQAQISRLSPAEKFDLLRGRYDFPLVRAERARTSADAPRWEGLCHGWAPVALLLKEPRPVIANNAKGLKIPFGSSDIKALLTYHQGQLAYAPSKMLGQRCNDDFGRFPNSTKRPACEDVNAGAFHLVLANRIGLRKEGFVADMTRDAEVWNQPVYAFRSRVVQSSPASDGAARGTVEEKRIQTDLYYAIEVDPSWKAQNTILNRGRRKESLEYIVEMDARGRIIGGRWLSENRPDFLWVQSLGAFRGEWKILEDLYNQSTNS